MATDNKLDQLGGNMDAPPSGKYLDPNHICLKPTEVKNLYPADPSLNMMVRRIEDEYPQYVKNDTTGDINFKRSFKPDPTFV